MDHSKPRHSPAQPILPTDVHHQRVLVRQRLLQVLVAAGGAEVVQAA